MQVDRNKVLTLTFDNQHNRDLTMLLLNSNIHYWFWMTFGDGFVTNIDMAAQFPVPDVSDNEVVVLASRLFGAIEECKVKNAHSGITVPNLNFNKRMDILLDIDDWIVKHVAPDLNLPRDIFAQYKSNSFLRPLDLSAITGAEDMEGEE